MNTQGSSYYECPISACDWKHFVPPIEVPDAPDELHDMSQEFERVSRETEDAIRAHCETHSVEDWLRQIMLLRAQLADAQAMAQPNAGTLVQLQGSAGLVCFGCYAEAHNARQQGVPEEQIPPLSPAMFVVEGRSLAPCHTKLQNGPVIPGRTASGIVLPNGAQPPQAG